jgi:hypothetical protein
LIAQFIRSCEDELNFVWKIGYFMFTITIRIGFQNVI